MKTFNRASGLWTLLSVAIVASTFSRIAHQREEQNLTICQCNLDNLAANPKSLLDLTPEDLEKIPICPSAGKVTYYVSYFMPSSPDRFTIYCAGHNHAASGIPPDYPHWSTTTGPVER